jgi:hypothetical protein
LGILPLAEVGPVKTGKERSFFKDMSAHQSGKFEKNSDIRLFLAEFQKKDPGTTFPL